MDNPTMLYRCPGGETFEGVSCETCIVEDADVEAAIADGWHRNWMQASEAHKAAAAQLAANEAEQAEIAQKLASTGMRAVHKGRGKYDVLDAAGEVVASGLSKEEALATAGG